MRCPACGVDVHIGPEVFRLAEGVDEATEDDDDDSGGRLFG